MVPSSLEPFDIPFTVVYGSGRASEDWDRFRAFCAEPRIPSRLKPVVFWILAEVGDLRAEPLMGLSCGEGTSIEKLSLVGRGYGRLVLLAPPIE